VELLSEEEQWERVKAWLRTNGPSVLVLSAVILLGVFGWKWWKGHQDQQSLDAGTTYQSILAAFDSGRKSDGLAQIESLRGEHPDSPYVDAADLYAATVHVGDNELDRAVERLKRVAENSKDPKLRPVARLRLARVQAAQEQYDAALATLGTQDMGLHEPARLEVRGDILFAKGDREGALKEYEAARARLPALERQEGAVGELLDLKIADLGGSPAPLEPEVEAATPAAATATDTAPAPETTP
jgi:predicted negative regulator of RcsB-dependent stress response